MKSAFDTYKSVTIDTASQGKLILICYDVAISSCKQALETFGDLTKVSMRSKHLFKAQDAISELMSALKMDVGEISHNLYRLYDYFLRRLVESNIKNDKAKTEEVLRHLESLREAWALAIEKVKRETTVPLMVGMGQGLVVTG